MRLTPTQAIIIRDAVHRHFGEDADVRLFGSRTDDSKRGGDIDLYVETSLPSADAVWTAQRRCLAALYMALGEQKIDLVVSRRASQSRLPIHDVASSEGIRL